MLKLDIIFAKYFFNFNQCFHCFLGLRRTIGREVYFPHLWICDFDTPSRDNCSRNGSRFGTMSYSVLLQGSQVELVKCNGLTLVDNARLLRRCKTLTVGQNYSQIVWARPGFEPGTSRTRSENHTPRPTSRLLHQVEVNVAYYS